MMIRTVAQFGIMALVALAGPMTAPGQMSQTVESEVATTQTAEHRVDSREKKSTDTVSVVASNLPLARIISQIEEQSGVPILIRGTAADVKATVIVPKGQTVYEVLLHIVDSNPDLLLKQTVFKSDGQEITGYEIWETSGYQKAASVVEVYQVNEAKAASLEKFIRSILSSGTGNVLADNRLNKLVVYDVPEKQAEVRKLLTELDQKLRTQVFAIRHREARKMANLLERFFSLPSDQLAADNESGQVAVKGTKETIARVELFVEAFDVPPLKGDTMTSSP